MFIAMNRFKIIPDLESDFEAVWKSRETYLANTPGFISFNLLKGPRKEEYTLYASHTSWTSRKDFENWTKSENFRRAHAGAGSRKSLYLGHPEFEGFEAITNK